MHCVNRVGEVSNHPAVNTTVLRPRVSRSLNPNQSCEMKRNDMCLAEVSPGRAPSSSQAPRREGERRQRHQPPPSDRSPAAAAAARPSFSPQGSTGDACLAAEAAVRESPICAFLPTVSPLFMLRAPPAPIQRAYCQHWRCRTLQDIYPPPCPI